MKVIFKVEDFLKIEKAEIDITNFCVFIGNNNSGKTKLMELIYGVLEYLPKKVPEVDLRFRNDKIIYDEEKIRKLIACANDILAKEKEAILQNIFNKELSIGSIELKISEIDKKYEIVKITEENVSILPEEDAKLYEIFKEPEKKITLVKIDVYEIKEEVIRQNIGIMEFHGSGNWKFMKSRINRMIMCDLLRVGSVSRGSSLFFPASRMGLAMLYKEYFNSVGSDGKLWNGENTFLEEDTYQQSDHVTKPVLDFLRFLQGYSYNIYSAKRNIKLIEFINEHLLDGALDEQGDVASYKPKDSEIKVPLYLASSMINELDPVIKMLTDRSLTKSLFYDEIETSLHPLKQLEMVKLLNRLNNNGIRIVLATHSDTFVTKLNNLLLIARSGKMDKDSVCLQNGKIEISRDDLLQTDDIHIYQFVNKNNGRSEVKELEFRTVPMIGYSFELFEDSSTSLFEETKLALGIE